MFKLRKKTIFRTLNGVTLIFEAGTEFKVLRQGKHKVASMGGLTFLRIGNSFYIMSDGLFAKVLPDRGNDFIGKLPPPLSHL